MSIISELMPPKPKWLPANDMPDCTGKVFLVTGGNSGIGFETVKELLKKGGKVYLAARSRSKGEEAITSLEKETGKRAIFLELDLGNLASVKRSAQTFIDMEPQLNVLINNAGVMACPVEMITSDGYDLQFGTNVIGHWYFTTLLLPTILATADANPAEKPRIVNVTSNGHRCHPSIDYDILRDGPKRHAMSTVKLYGQSKFGNIVVSNELARRYDDKIVSISVHPGGIKTNLQRHYLQLPLGVQNWMMADPWMGAITQLYAATSPEAADLNGKYLIPYARLGRPNPKADDVRTGTDLWKWLEEQVKEL
ncbi:NAD(P)-binding protein [Exidia glandulosa HHB12029]|uniref:NAD(P)-binding protein n=1 Tax=Exidia glandulosa HHB12029 TaxID=1314781 RepID=A0A165ZNJ6_EXIGL|nr:NAD(P)-binding protein [Exidia glandulosa HHB12029]